MTHVSQKQQNKATHHSVLTRTNTIPAITPHHKSTNVHWHTHNGVNSFTLKHTYTERDTKRDRERVTERMSGEEKVVCVTGASGYIASWLVKHLLQRGCTVKATVRDTSQCLSLSLQFVSTCYYELKLHTLF